MNLEGLFEGVMIILEGLELAEVVADFGMVVG